MSTQCRCSSSRKVSYEWLATLWEYNRTNNRNNINHSQTNNSALLRQGQFIYKLCYQSCCTTVSIISCRVSCVATRSVLILSVVFYSESILNAHFEIMFCTQDFSSLVCLILLFLILYYLIKMYRELDPSENHQQPLTEARRNRGNRAERINDKADPHIRHATEHNERQGWVSVFYFWNCLKLVTDFFYLWRSCTVYEITRRF